MKALAIFLALHLFPCTALVCGSWLLCADHPSGGAALIALAMLTRPRIEPRG